METPYGVFLTFRGYFPRLTSFRYILLIFTGSYSSSFRNQEFEVTWENTRSAGHQCRCQLPSLYGPSPAAALVQPLPAVAIATASSVRGGDRGPDSPLRSASIVTSNHTAGDPNWEQTRPVRPCGVQFEDPGMQFGGDPL